MKLIPSVTVVLLRGNRRVGIPLLPSWERATAAQTLGRFEGAGAIMERKLLPLGELLMVE